MFEIIKAIIDEWDPISLLEFAPSDEYDYECRLIFENYIKHKEKLGKTIFDIFKYCFGDEFQKDIVECDQIAKDIESANFKKYEE